MSNDTMKHRIQQALDAELSGVHTTPRQRDQIYENAIGGTKVKRKITAGLVLVLVLVLMMAAAVAAVLLTRQEIVEKVAVPLAVENDTGIGVFELLEGLSPDERKLATGLYKGATQKELAARLAISQQSVSKRIGRLREKLRVSLYS